MIIAALRNVTYWVSCEDVDGVRCLGKAVRQQACGGFDGALSVLVGEDRVELVDDELSLSVVHAPGVPVPWISWNIVASCREVWHGESRGGSSCRKEKTFDLHGEWCLKKNGRENFLFERMTGAMIEVPDRVPSPMRTADSDTLYRSNVSVICQRLSAPSVLDKITSTKPRCATLGGSMTMCKSLLIQLTTMPEQIRAFIVVCEALRRRQSPLVRSAQSYCGTTWCPCGLCRNKLCQAYPLQ